MFPAETTPSLMTEEDSTIDLRQYISLFLQWWWLIVLATGVAGVSAYVISKQMTPVYQASTTLLINEAPSNKANDYNSILTSQQLAQTYAQMLTKRPVMESVIALLGLDITPDELSASVSATPVRDTQLIVISVEHTDPGIAALLANTIGDVFARQVKQTQSDRFAASKESLQQQMADLDAQIKETRTDLETTKNAPVKDAVEIGRLDSRLSQYNQIYSSLVLSYEQIRLAEAQTLSNLVPIEEAIVPKGPISPKTMQNTMLAAVVGMMLAVGGIFVYSWLDDTIKNPEMIQQQLRLPILGWIGEFAENGTSLIAASQPRSPVTESFRALRSNVQYASVDKPIRSLLITSSSPSDGKSTIASNLAIVLAQIGKKVTLVDADLHRPRIHRLFNLDRVPGLSALFVQPTLYINGSRQATQQQDLGVVASGELPPNPSELLSSRKMRDILDLVTEQSDIVILDTPPVMAVNDAVALAPLVDGVLVVVKPGETKMGLLKVAVEQLRGVGGNVIGVVLNGAEKKRSPFGYSYNNYYYNHYYYQKSYRSDGPEGKPGGQKSGSRIIKTPIKTK